MSAVRIRFAHSTMRKSVPVGGRSSYSRIGIAQNAQVSACHAGLGTHMDDAPQHMEAVHPEARLLEDAKLYQVT